MAKTFWGRAEMVAGQKLYDCAHKQEANTVLPFELLTFLTDSTCMGNVVVKKML